MLRGCHQPRRGREVELVEIALPLLLLLLPAPLFVAGRAHLRRRFGLALGNNRLRVVGSHRRPLSVRLAKDVGRRLVWYKGATHEILWIAGRNRFAHTVPT